MNFDKNIPNLNHNLFGKLSDLGNAIPKNKKRKESKHAQRLIFLSFSKGYNPIKAKKIQNTIAKLRSELFLIFILF